MLLELAELAVHFLLLLLEQLVLEFFRILRLLIVKFFFFLLGSIDHVPLVSDGGLDLLFLLHLTEQIIIDLCLVEDLVLHLVELCPFL